MNELVDFGKHVIPQSIKDRYVCAYIFKGYWEDIGTIRAFFEANLDLTDICAALQFLRAGCADLHAPRFLPGAKSTAQHFARRSSPMAALFRMRTSSAVSSECAALYGAARRFGTAS